MNNGNSPWPSISQHLVLESSTGSQHLYLWVHMGIMHMSLRMVCGPHTFDNSLLPSASNVKLSPQPCAKVPKYASPSLSPLAANVLTLRSQLLG